jgi:hypothetical protein
MLSGQGSTLFSGINGMIGVICAIQLWLVSAALSALYENDLSAVEPAFIASAILFLFNVVLLRYALAFDKLRRTERSRAGKPSRGGRGG